MEIKVNPQDFVSIMNYLLDGFRVGDTKKTFYYYSRNRELRFHNSIVDIPCEYVHFANMPYIAYKPETKRLAECRCDEISCDLCPLNWICGGCNLFKDENMTLKQLAERFNVSKSPMSVLNALTEELEKEVKVNE